MTTRPPPRPPSKAGVALSLAGTAALAFVVGRARLPSASADEAHPRVPVLVELFTSEGCSSCPPAEDELVRLDGAQPIEGVEIIPVAFHVDYWNDLGWADPLSSSAWSDRQRDYDRASGRVYTPQAVVQGTSECVGSDDRALRALVREAATAPPASFGVTSTFSPSPSGTVRVSVVVRPGALRDQAALRVVLVERGLVVDVPRGENRGQRLAHAPAARDLVSAGVVDPTGGTFEATLRVPPRARRENLRVVAFAAGPTNRVVGLGTSPVP